MLVDKVKVKLLGFDDRGKTRLSMKVVDQATGEDIEAKLKPKYPFATMAVGDEHTEPVSAGVENIRAMAAYQKSKHGRRFTVSKRDDGIVITRVE